MLIPNVLNLIEPDIALPLIFDSPHSGTHYPDDFHYACDFNTLEKAEDKYVDELFINAPNHGAPLLCALFPRTYIDVNRAIDDIDTALLDAPWPYDKCVPNPTNRSYAGIGLIRRLIKPNMEVYNTLLSPKDIKSRIETYYTPYHNTLERTLDKAHSNYGQVWHINCHSMPSSAVSAKTSDRATPFIQPDFVLGDRDGISCAIGFTHTIRDFLKKKGYIVAINKPYKGVELVHRYSAPSIGRHSLQIEINRALYLDENTYKKNKNFDNLKSDMIELVAHLADYTQSQLTPMAAQEEKTSCI